MCKECIKVAKVGKKIGMTKRRGQIFENCPVEAVLFLSAAFRPQSREGMLPAALRAFSTALRASTVAEHSKGVDL